VVNVHKSFNVAACSSLNLNPDLVNDYFLK